MLLGHRHECPDQVADRATGQGSLGAPEDTGVLPALDAPRGVERLVVGTVVRHEHATLLGGEGELLLVRYPPVGTVDLMHGDGVNILSTQAGGDAIAHVFVEEEAQGHY